MKANEIRAKLLMKNSSAAKLSRELDVNKTSVNAVINKNKNGRSKRIAQAISDKIECSLSSVFEQYK